MARDVLSSTAMPTLDHAVLVELFRQRSDLATRLVQGRPNTRLPRHARTDWQEAVLDLRDGVEYRADLLVRLLNARGRVRLVFVLEVQRRRDRTKPYTWPVYLGVVRRRFLVPSLLLVITPSASVARWAKQPIALGGATVLVPCVIGPDETPRVTDLAEARRHPELAILSARMHGAAPDGEPVLRAALEALTVVDPELARVYIRFIDDTLPRDRPSCWKGPAMLRDEFKHVTLPKHFQQWVDLGERRGKAEGKAEGRAEGKAEALLAVLAARGVPVDDAARARIHACTNPVTLDRWIARAVTAPDLDAILSD